MNLEFRKASIADIPLISELADKIWKEHYPSIISVEQISYMLESRYSPVAIEKSMMKGEKYFIACENSKAVAYASLELLGNFFYLHKFYTDVSKHRKGIGQQFFNYLLTQIDPTKPIKLQVNRQNFKAVNFYFKVGFVIESVGDFHIGGGYYMNDFVMARKPI
ncbi:MAG: GNAT family N-acetyltransferase [Bacteroidota bacterium]